MANKSIEGLLSERDEIKISMNYHFTHPVTDKTKC